MPGTRPGRALRPILPRVLVGLLGLTALSPAAAQDSHYWDSQFGTKAELLGGLVVGAPTDLSATFYNPAWIAQRQEPSVLLTTKAVEGYRLELENAFGTATDATTTSYGASPGYLAGRFSLGDDRGWKWAYTYLEKVRFVFDDGGSTILADPGLPPGGLAWEALETFRVSDVAEGWYGFSFSRKLSDRVAIGFSPYAAQRSQRSRTQIAGQVLAADTSRNDINLVEDYRYWHLRLLMKIGVAVEGEYWTAGLTVTTPSLGLMGSGEMFDRVYSSGGYDPNDPTGAEPFLQVDAQEDLDTDWRSPLSIAAGAAWHVGASRLHVTAEWFDAVERYDVIDPARYEIQSRPGEFDRADLSYAADRVLNYGLGLERIFSERFSLFTSYRLDQTTSHRDRTDRINTTAWDLHHVTAGASFELLSMEFTAGLQYSWGEVDLDPVLDLGENIDDDIVLANEPGTLRFERLKVLLGFNLPFATPGS